MNSGQTGGRATFTNGEKVPFGRSCYKNWITPADLTVSGPQPLCPGNYESLKLSSPRGSSNRVSPIILSARPSREVTPSQMAKDKSAPADGGRYISLAFAAAVPVFDGLHSWFVPGSV